MAGKRVMLSDTVGFVRDLPHHLIASFRATLEEATHADCLLIVLDVSDLAAELQLQTVEETLEELFEEVREREKKAGVDWHEPARILLLNKSDRLKDNTEMLVWRQRRPEAIPFCGRDVGGQGQAELIERIGRLSRGTVRGHHDDALERGEGRALPRDAVRGDRPGVCGRVGADACADRRPSTGAAAFERGAVRRGRRARAGQGGGVEGVTGCGRGFP